MHKCFLWRTTLVTLGPMFCITPSQEKKQNSVIRPHRPIFWLCFSTYDLNFERETQMSHPWFRDSEWTGVFIMNMLSIELWLNLYKASSPTICIVFLVNFIGNFGTNSRTFQLKGVSYIWFASDFLSLFQFACKT